MYKKIKILLVDDDVFFQELISKVLEKNGYETVVAVNGDDAIMKAQANSFDLVITDLFMPEKEGLEVIQEIHEMFPDIKIIAISSDALTAHSSFLKVAEVFGAKSTLKKPFTAEEILKKVSDVMKEPITKKSQKIIG